MQTYNAVAFVVYNLQTNLYWSRYPEGWVDQRHQATWSDLYEATQDAKNHGGIVVPIEPDDAGFTGKKSFYS